MRYAPGDILLASLVFSGQDGSKKRPVLVVIDNGDDDLLVVPVTSHAVRSSWDVPVIDWNHAGLRLPSIVRLNKFATIAKSVVVRHLGKIGSNDRTRIGVELQKVCQVISAGW